MIGQSNAIVVVTAVASIAFLLTLLTVPVARLVSRHVDVLDVPREGKGHTVAMPYLGGVAIALAALAVPAFLDDWPREAGLIAVGALMVSGCGLVDDIRTLSPCARLTVEIAAASLVVFAGARVELTSYWLDAAITIVWLVIITNAFNLLDNMDGVASTIATATALGLAVAAVLQGQVLVGALAAAVAGACVGFLVYNWHPASIFMGDAGSLMLGFLIAAIALKLRWPTGHHASVTAILLIMFPAVFDTALVVVSRRRAGRSIFVGGTDHTSHRLHRLGVPIRWVAPILGLFAGLSVSLGVLVGRGVVGPLLALIPLFLAALLAIVPLLRLPVYAGGSTPVRLEPIDDRYAPG